MRLSTPSFWYRPRGLKALVLSIFMPFYAAAHFLRQGLTKQHTAAIPVICVGNLVAGGSGKTPGALAVMKLVRDMILAENPCFLIRGYGGSLKGPLLVDREKHTATDVGDEALLLAQSAPTIVAANRAEGATYAEQHKFDLIVMDDGMQNPGLAKGICFVVVDGATGFGNRMLLPAGPLREPLKCGIGRADAFIIVGDDQRGVRKHLPDDMPVFHAALAVPDHWIGSAETRYIAFCGIAHPDKFRRTLAQAGIHVAALHPFPDHYNFTPADIEKLMDDAHREEARLITTAKDAARLPPHFAHDAMLDILPVVLEWDDRDNVAAFLNKRLGRNEKN